MEMKAARAQAGLTQAAFGALIGVTGRTVRRWESGDVAIPGAQAFFLRSRLVAHGLRQKRVSSQAS